MITKINWEYSPHSIKIKVDDLERGDWFILKGEIYLVYDQDPERIFYYSPTLNINDSFNFNTQNYEISRIKEVAIHYTV